jgi:polysaccharide pyruvyl transferase WcaK-like protein
MIVPVVRQRGHNHKKTEGWNDADNCARAPRIALLTPYNGGNLGDAAIQDALISNLRVRLEGVRIAGISLNCDNFVERHGTEAFPLCGNGRPFYEMSYGSVAEEDPRRERKKGNEPLDQIGIGLDLKSKVREQFPALWLCLRAVYSWLAIPWREVRHWLRGYQFLRTQDLLIVSGGGQIDEEWGGPWAHPYALFKWATLARFARVQCAIASVGVGKVTSTRSRVFLAAALRMAQYRSFRDKHSRELAAKLLGSVAKDPIVPDLAFTLPPPTGSPSLTIQPITGRRTVVAISPIAYAKPKNWPQQDKNFYDCYIRHMAEVVSDLVQRNYSIVIVYSSLGDDQSVIRDLLEQVDDDKQVAISHQVRIPTIATWQDFLTAVQDADFLIASRLHSAILGFVAKTPTIAISFGPKVDWVMEDLGMSEFLLHIRDFETEDVIQTLDRLILHRKAVQEQIASYKEAITAVCERQYDFLAALALPQLSF